MMRAKWSTRILFLLGLSIGAIGLSPHTYGYNALVPLMVSNLNRLQNLLVELAMSDFEGAAQVAKSIAGNAKAIHDLAHLVVTDQDPKQIQAFQ